MMVRTFPSVAPVAGAAVLLFLFASACAATDDDATTAGPASHDGTNGAKGVTPLW